MPRSRAAALVDQTTPLLAPGDGHGTRERAYAATASPAHRKAFGQYFTPPTLAALMADWIGQIDPVTILDPAYGTGILSAAALERCPAASVVAFEKDPQILRFSQIGQDSRLALRHEDYLCSNLGERYDAVTMN